MRRTRRDRSTIQLAPHLGGPRDVRFRFGRLSLAAVSLVVTVLLGSPGFIEDLPTLVSSLKTQPASLFPEDSAGYTAKGLPPLTEEEFQFEHSKSPGLLKAFLAIRTNREATTIAEGLLGELETNERTSPLYTQSLVLTLKGQQALQMEDFQAAINSLEEASRLAPSQNCWATFYLYKAYKALDQQLRSQPLPWSLQIQEQLHDLGQKLKRLELTFPTMVSKLERLEKSFDTGLARFLATGELDCNVERDAHGHGDEIDRRAFAADNVERPSSVASFLHLAAHGSVGAVGTVEEEARLDALALAMARDGGAYPPLENLRPAANAWTLVADETLLRNPSVETGNTNLVTNSLGGTGRWDETLLRDPRLLRLLADGKSQTPLAPLVGAGQEAVRLAAGGEASPTRPGRARALVFGINSYGTSGLTSLQYATRDAGRVARALADLGYDPAVLRDGAATKANILNLVVDDVLRSQPGDRLVLYFSGHGAADAGGERALITDGGRAALSLRELAAVLSYHRGDTIVIADSCFDQREFNLGIDTVAFALGDNRTSFVLGGSPGGIAVESPKLRSGVFTQALVDYLHSDRVRLEDRLDLDLLAQVTAAETARLADNLHNVVQLPVLLVGDGTAEPSPAGQPRGTPVQGDDP